ncbi:MAG TPA: winged helix-turn-helix transcriptional regulator [Spirochaetota bacterium]|nr:winged helix-turn-helix transcriptional regulator [Spirochaetota bacterium]HPI90029.1 winged helix-turn-helix transcriptional regulator [Spirochaetota bacterium]HPR48089.1 winged helix-turn-helix transcriptional regulator [Spirochaetota bacterium]
MKEELYSDDEVVGSFRLREDVLAFSGVLSPETADAFRALIKDYYSRHRRDFPWRRTSDPYHIVVSEVMLQQTQTDRVALKFPEFISRFPTIESLASAELSEVLLAWQGLGYNRRGMMLHRLARKVAAEREGRIPDTPEELVDLPGIGRATAASIAVFAFNRPLVFIETNIRSVFIHFFFFDKENIADSMIVPLVEATLDRESPYHWYSALMDYGAMLKKRHVNPGRKSAHYQKQSPFRGSRRQVRGMILRVLLNEPGLGMDDVCTRIGGDASTVRSVMNDLVEEGIVKNTGSGYAV